jgi:hypothetical protein
MIEAVRACISGLTYPWHRERDFVLNGVMERSGSGVVSIEAVLTPERMLSLAPAMLAEWMRSDPAAARWRIRERLDAPAAAVEGRALNRQRIEEAVLRALNLVLDDMAAQPGYYATVAEELI